jgi:hypothetical protein
MWLRLLVLGGLGVGLAFPLVRSLLEGSFSGDSLAAAAAAEDFLTAVHEGQQSHVSALLTPDAASAPVILGWSPEFAPLRSPFLSFQRGDVRTQKDNAEVAFTLHFHEEPDQPVLPGARPELFGEEAVRNLLEAQRQRARKADGWKGAVQLRRAEGAWKVSAVIPPSEDGKSPVIGFPLSKPIALDVRPFEDWAAVDAQQFAASWQTDLEVQDRPAKDVLTDLEGNLGLLLMPPVEAPAGPGLPKAQSQPVSLHLHGRSRLEAIEDACRQAGLHAEYQMGIVRVRQGPRPWPAACAGPFLVEVESVKEFPPWPTGMLTLKCLAARLPAPVADLLSTDDEAFLPTHVTAANGSDLYRANYASSAPRAQVPAGLDTRIYEKQMNVPLKNLLRDLDVIHEVRGRVRVVLPTKVSAVRFDSLVPGTVQQAGGVRLTLRQPGGTAPGRAELQAVLEFETQGADGLALRWMAYDAKGTALRGDRGRPAPNGLLRLEVPGDTAAVALKVVTQTQKVVFPFELRDIPLQRVPRHIEPLHFSGHAAPVEVEVLRIGPPSGGASPGAPGASVAVDLRVRNFSQKDLEHLRMKFTYLDAVGQRLKEAEREGGKSPALEGRPAAVVRANSEDTLTVNDPDRPEGTSRITAVLLAVSFADGTTWFP